MQIGAIVSGLAARAERAAAAVRRRQRPRRRRLRQHRRLARRPNRAWPQGRQGRRPPDAPAQQAPPAGRRRRRRARSPPRGHGRWPAGPARSATRRCAPTPTRSSSTPPRPVRTWTGCGSSPRPPTRPGAPQHPDDDPPGKGFEDRFLQLDTTMDGAGRLVRRPDPRVRGRGHRGTGGAGQEARPRGRPDRGAAIPRRAAGGLRTAHPGQDGARPGGLRYPRRRRRSPCQPCAAWTARPRSRRPGCGPGPGEHGYLAGKDAEAIACDALIVPVVTGTPDWAVIDQMITLVTAAHAQPRARQPPGQRASPATLPAPRRRCRRRAGEAAVRAGQAGHRLRLRPRRHRLRPAPHPARRPAQRQERPPRRRLRRPHPRRPSAAPSSAATSTAPGPAAATAPPPSATCTTSPTKRTAAPTSVKDCALFCQYHHDVCIHRWGWEIELLPDGTVRATGPQGQVISSHPPPTIPTG